jgi:two-component system, chemotaxis family, response regulator Rcp1
MGLCMHILLVEDNPADVRLIREAFRVAEINYALSVATSGEAALAKLRDEPKLPSLILLDLKLPGMQGTEVLESIKEDSVLCRIPVIVLSSSSAAEDVRAVYNGHANCFIRKPPDFPALLKVAQAIQQFWIALVRLPDGSATP